MSRTVEELEKEARLLIAYFRERKLTNWEANLTMHIAITVNNAWAFAQYAREQDMLTPPTKN